MELCEAVGPSSDKRTIPLRLALKHGLIPARPGTLNFIHVQEALRYI